MRSGFAPVHLSLVSSALLLACIPPASWLLGDLSISGAALPSAVLLILSYPASRGCGPGCSAAVGSPQRAHGPGCTQLAPREGLLDPEVFASL